MLKRLPAFLLAIAAAALPAAAAEPHPFTAQDLLAMERISEPQPSPKGDRVAFVVRTTDLEANRGRTDLWMVNADGSGLIRLTTDPAADNNPRWAPDGKSLYFLSTRSGSSQVWRIPASGGDAVQVTDLPLDVANLTVSPDGSRLAFSLEVFPDCPTLACTKERLDQKGEDQGLGAALPGRRRLLPPLGHLVGGPAQPPVRDAGLRRASPWTSPAA